MLLEIGVVALAGLQILGVVFMIFLVLRFFASLFFKITRKPVEMMEVYGPERSFAISVPKSWNDQSEDEHFFVNASKDGPVLAGSSWRFDEAHTLRQFADTRFKSVGGMPFYKPVGKDFELENGGIVREHAGSWPGEWKEMSYVVACFGGERRGADIALTTSRRDYRKSKALYLQIFESLQILPLEQQTTLNDKSAGVASHEV